MTWFLTAVSVGSAIAALIAWHATRDAFRSAVLMRQQMREQREQIALAIAQRDELYAAALMAATKLGLHPLTYRDELNECLAVVDRLWNADAADADDVDP